MDGLTLPNDGVSSVQHTSYLRLRPAYDQAGREIPIEILKVQETAGRTRSMSTFSIFLRYAYGERLPDFNGNIAACSVFIEMDEFGQPNSQIKFTNDGSLVVSEEFRDMGADTYIMKRIALWLEQTALHTRFSSLASRTNQEKHCRNDLNRDRGFEPIRVYGSVAMHTDPKDKNDPITMAWPLQSSLMADLPPFAPDDLLQEINIIDELNAKAEAARKSESDRMAVRIAHSFVLNKLVRSEFLNRAMSAVIIVQIVALILLIGYTWPIR